MTQFDSASEPETAAQTVSAYAEWHRAEWVSSYYDDVLYDPSGYDAFIWAQQEPLLSRLFRRLGRGHARLKYLDFACGTARLLATLAPLTTESVGLDTSEAMLRLASAKAATSTLKCGDLLADPDVVDYDYDVITAFRFFVNNQPRLRGAIMAALAARLRGPGSRLVFNMHANAWSVWGLAAARQRLRGQDAWNVMTPREVARLVADAGLEVEACYGFGVVPRRLHRTRLVAAMRWIDRAAMRLVPFRWISQDLVYVCRPTPTRPA